VAWLPGQFLDENANLNASEFFKKFSKAVGAAEIIPTRHNVARAQQAPEDLPADLLCAEAVLVRRDDHVPPLEPLYNGPYRVLTRSRDFFQFQMGGGTDTVSTSRLKPCLDLLLPQLHHLEDVPQVSGRTSPSVGRPWRRRRPVWLCRRPLLPRLLGHWLLLGRQHHLRRGPEPFFPTARGFLHAWTPARSSGPPHRPGGCNDSVGRRPN
jgi:hypothetical protein